MVFRGVIREELAGIGFMCMTCGPVLQDVERNLEGLGVQGINLEQVLGVVIWGKESCLGISALRLFRCTTI